MFAHDHVFQCDSNGAVYSDGKLPYAVMSRYLQHFDSVTIVARKATSSADASVAQLNLTSGPGVSFTAIPSLSSPLSLLTHRAQARDILESVLRQSDALISRLPSEIGSLAISVAKRLGIPWAVEVVEDTWDGLWNHGTWQGKVYAPYATLRTKHLIKQAPFALYVTRHALQRRYPTNGIVVNCSNVEISPSDESVFTARIRRIKQPPDCIRIGLIGSLAGWHKGIGITLEALALVRDRLGKFEFHILGGGDDKVWRERAAQLNLGEHVQFVGVLPGGERVRQWLDEVDLYVQPSFQEGLPRALIEAMSRGCPALGSTAGGIPELLSGDCLHRPGDASTLAQQLVKGVSDIPWRCDQAGRNFQEAMGYTKPILDARRRGFWQQFAAYARDMRAATDS